MQTIQKLISSNLLRLGFLITLLLSPACGQLDLAWGPLLYAVDVTPDAITPNADGDQDVTQISYRLRRAAAVSIYFTK
ncbi:MAG: hypothetical protein R3E79_20190 [Caldilineaceae bacterium]